ncbi:MAG: hypothetical protein QW051_05000 [Candidatus Aenigmatarchaeota archaeon]
MKVCLLCENELENGDVCKFCGLNNKLTKFDVNRKIYEFVWPEFCLRYRSRNGKSINMFVNANRGKILMDLEKRSIKLSRKIYLQSNH